MTTDDHTCVLLLDSVTLRQVLATRDVDDADILVRLNLAAAGITSAGARGLIGRGGRHALAADRARHPSAGRHAAVETATGILSRTTAPAPSVSPVPSPAAQQPEPPGAVAPAAA